MTSQRNLPPCLVLVLFIFGFTFSSANGQVTTFVPNCNGIDDTLEFSSIISGAAGNPRTIRIPYYDDLNKRCKVTTLTVPAHITLDNTDGIGIALDSPNVLTVLGPVMNPVGKTLFFGTGTTSFAGNAFVGTNGQARLSNGAGVDTWGIPDGIVPATRSVNTAGPLSGGGDLTADRTIACPTCAVTTDSLSQFAPTTSSNLADMITDETGTGALVFADSPTFTGNVGIGTSSPPSILTVQTSGADNAGEKYLRVRNTSSFTGLLLDPGQTGDVKWLLMGGYPNAGDFTVRQFGLGNFLTIKKTTGNIGIGTTAPDAKLQVLGASTNTNLPDFQFADTPLVLRNTSLTNNNFNLISLQDAAGFGNVVFGGVQTNQATHSGEFLLMTRNSGTIGERLRVDRTGNLLLGTTASPTANAGKVMVFGNNGSGDPTMAPATAGLFAKDVAGITRLFATDATGNETQLTGAILGGASPTGADGDVQIKSGGSLAPGAINDNGSVLSLTRPVNATGGNFLLGTTASPTANGGKVFVFGESGATNPTMATNTAGLFAKNVSGIVKLFAIDEDGAATQLTGSENVANKSADPSLGTSNILYPTQNAVKQYVDNHAPGSGPFPEGNDGDLQMKAGAVFAASGINDDGSMLSFNRPVKFAQSDIGFARWTFNNDNSLSLAATLAPPTAPSAALLSDATGACTAGNHQFKVTYITAAGETNASPASNVVTCNAGQTKVTITLPTGSTTNGLNTIATGRNIYATKAGGSTYFLIAPSPVVNNNTSTTYTFSINDLAFGTQQVPDTNTAVDNRIFVDNLGNVGFGTTQPQFTDDSQGRSVAIDGGSAEGYLGIGTTDVTDPTGRVGALNFYNIAQGGVDHRVAAIFAFNDGALGKGSLVFSTSAGIIGPSGAGSINSEQNWGIGRNAVSGVKLIIQAADTSPTKRALSVNNASGSVAFLNIWNDGKVQFSNGSVQIDSGPFRVSSAGDVAARSVQLTSAAKPACDATSRGKFWYTAGASGVKDTVEICAKDAADVFAWRVLY